MLKSRKTKISFMTAISLVIILCSSCTKDTIPNSEKQNNLSCYTSSEGLFEFTVQSGNVRVDFVNSHNGNIEVPAQIHNFEVTEIGDSAFYQNDCTSVNLPSTLQSIQANAFYRCPNIQEIVIPAKTECIIGNPFFRCSGLENIHVQSGNINYSDIDGVLYDAAETTLLAYPEGRSEDVYEIPFGVTKIEDEAFGYDAHLEIVIIPESVTDFPEYNLFATCKQVSLVVTPGSEAEEYATKHGIPVTHST